MFYEVGTKAWTETGKLSTNEKIVLTAKMETDIIDNAITYQDDYFYWLIVAFKELQDDAKSFIDFKKYKDCIERLEWLRRKNAVLLNRKRFTDIINSVSGKLYDEQVIELLDTYEELTGQ